MVVGVFSDQERNSVVRTSDDKAKGKWDAIACKIRQ